jgi:hypothetical protein
MRYTRVLYIYIYIYIYMRSEEIWEHSWTHCGRDRIFLYNNNGMVEKGTPEVAADGGQAFVCDGFA